VRDGAYHYGRPTADGAYRHATLNVERYPLTAAALREPHANLYYAAAFLRVFTEQCPAIDRAFDSVAHRHAVSHSVWGDRVRSSVPEDRILTARRRLLQYYGAFQQPSMHHRGIRFISPLDGGPRVAIGLMGDARRGGRRVHAGIDIRAALGEPVRAMSDGRVVLAAVDLGSRGLRTLEPEQAARVPATRMGARGLLVRIDHGANIETLYVHLDSYTVSTGDRVERGQVIGYAGRTGMHTSNAHLHLGLFEGDAVIDPLRLLHPLVLTGDRAPDIDISHLHDPLRDAPAPLSVENPIQEGMQRKTTKTSVNPP
jgi:murein DD-endopeptidase MepM/ murein hydrolase activator NlpD